MAAKEPTVERRHREWTVSALFTGAELGALALEWVDCGGGSIPPYWERVAKGFAWAEALATEKAWDEGYASGTKAQEDIDEGLDPDANPYRLPAEVKP